jgi:hypothetical protein
VDRSGSRGVFLLDGTSDLAELHARARDFSYTGRVMVEEYLAGPQISTETVLFDDSAVTPGFADRNYELLERFRPQVMENGGWIPSRCTTEQRAEVEALVTAAAWALGLRRGIAKGDVVLTPDGPRVIEIAARLSGGDFCESLVPLGTGVNYVRSAIEIAIGAEPDFAALVPTAERAVANRYFFPEPACSWPVHGVERVRAQPVGEEARALVPARRRRAAEPLARAPLRRLRGRRARPRGARAPACAGSTTRCASRRARPLRPAPDQATSAVFPEPSNARAMRTAPWPSSGIAAAGFCTSASPRASPTVSWRSSSSRASPSGRCGPCAR